jgi:hypothetical protein
MNALERSGFEVVWVEKYFVKEDLEDLFMYAGKFNPELYFDANYRKGISTFSLFTTPAEVDNGLAQLRKDIDSGEWEKVKERYDNDEGDYLFLVGKK